MRKILRISLWVLAGIVILLVGLFIYLRNADLSAYQDQIETYLSSQIGHELKVDGRFQLHFGGITRLVAEDVSLANPEWEADALLLEIGHLTLSVDFWSLFSSPVIIEELLVRDVRLRMQRSADGTSNWLPKNRVATSGSGEAIDLHRIAFRNVQIELVEFTLQDPALRRPVHAAIDYLTITPDENDILDLDVAGMINELPLWADGKLGPWQNLVDGQDISADFKLTLASVSLAVNGSVGDLPRLENVVADAQLSGPDISRVLDRLGLPPFATGEFKVEARVAKMEFGNQLRVEGNLGEIDLFASGNMDTLLASKELQLDFNFGGPDTQYVAELFGINGAPAEPFRVTGDVFRDGAKLTFENSRLQIGAESITLNGSLNFENRIPDGEVTVTASGPDFSFVGPFIGVAGLPDEAFTIKGRFQKAGAFWQASAVEAVIGQNRITVDGSLTAGGKDDAEIEIHVLGPDISIIQDFTDLQGIPARPFDVIARIQSDPAGIEVEEGVGVFGDNTVEVSGIVAFGPGMRGTSLTIGVAGPELHNVALLTGVPYLPDGPFEASGKVHIEQDALVLEEIDATAGDLSASVSGRVGLGSNAGLFDLNVKVSGPDAAKVAAIDLLQQFSGDAFSIEGHIEHTGEGYRSDAVSISIGDLESELGGYFLTDNNHVHVSISAKAANSDVLRKLTKLEHLPAGEVTIDGNIELTESYLRFINTELRVGENFFAADGTLSLHPMSNASDLRFNASGPSLKSIGMIFGSDVLVAKEFNVSGQFSGTPSGFEMRDFVATLGDNNLHGEFDVDLREKPQIVGTLSSTNLDISGGPETDAEPESEQDNTSKFVFSDAPLDMDKLQAANVDVELQIDRFRADALDVTDVQIGLHLRDGALRIEPFRMSENPGHIDGKLTLTPEGNSYSFDASISMENVHLRLMAAADQDPAELPPLGGSVSLTGSGASWHDIMASSNGQISLRHGAGKSKDIGGSRLFGDIFLQVLRTLNPLQKNDPYRTIDCGIYDISIVNGIATIETLAMQTSRTTMVATGQIDLRSEELDISFRAKPREGIGISLSTVTNEFLGVGGTLRSPKISLDARSSVTTTGVAVATGGLSLLARGMWDRMSAAASICEEEK